MMLTPFQLVWSRITFSRLTLLYFIFSVSHFIIQFALQVKAYTVNSEAHHIVSKLVNDAGTVNKSVPLLRGSRLYLCSWIPSNLNTDVASCPIIWHAEAETSNMAGIPSPSSPEPTIGPTPTSPSKSSVSVSPLSVLVSDLVIPTSTRVVEVDTEVLDRKLRIIRRGTPSRSGNVLNGAESTALSQQCLWALNWPRVVLQNTQREDVVFIAFQFWVLAVSVVALLNESIPHILASLLTHVMATAWGSFQVIHTANFRTDFNRVITNGACNQTILTATYWDARRSAEVPSIAFNGLALMVSCALTWKLTKLFGWQTFKRVGASLTINRIYKLVLSLSITIQLSLFFMVVTVSLWIDQLMNSGIGDFATFLTLYKTTSFITLVLLIPWLMTGWFAVRRELQVPMFIFLFLSVLYLAGWGVMFCSTTFRWTFMTWFFFSVMASTSVLLTCMAMILGIVCRFNFGKGLSRYLTPEQSQIEEDQQTNDIEKVPFPCSENPLPTFASLGGHSAPQFGFEPSARVHIVTFPQRVMQRDGSVCSHSSKSSTSSIAKSSYHSREGSNHSTHSEKQRWIIE